MFFQIFPLLRGKFIHPFAFRQKCDTSTINNNTCQYFLCSNWHSGKRREAVGNEDACPILLILALIWWNQHQLWAHINLFLETKSSTRSLENIFFQLIQILWIFKSEIYQWKLTTWCYVIFRSFFLLLIHLKNNLYADKAEVSAENLIYKTNTILSEYFRYLLM